jgi:transcriptional regulator with XRE-family HTH domain
VYLTNADCLSLLLGIKQDALASELGLSQQAVSALEQKEALDKDMLEKVAKALKVPSDAIKNFSDEIAINIISNTFNDNSVNMNYQCTFNPLNKYVEQVEENKRLYEALLKSEREKVALMEKMLDRK